MAGIKEALKKHDKVDDVTVRVRLAEIGTASLHIKVSAYVKVRNYEDYQDVQEQLNLAIMETAARAKVTLTAA